MTKKLFSFFLILCICFSAFSVIFMPGTQATASEQAGVVLSEYDYDGSVIRTTLNFYYLFEDCVMYAGIYNESGKITQLNKYAFQADSVETLTIRIPAQNISETDIVKIFFFGASNGVKPLCKNIVFSPMETRTKINGIVTATFRTDYTLYPGEARVFVTDTCNNSDLEDYLNNEILVTFTDDINIHEYIGMSAVMTLDISGYLLKITSLTPDEYTQVETLDIANIDYYTDDRIDYYPSPDSVKTLTYKLDAAVIIYYNYRDDEVFSFTELMEKQYSSSYSGDIEITLISNNGTSKYNVVMAKDYGYDVVDEVDTARDEIIGALGRYTFDFEDQEVDISIVDSNGSPIALDDIEEGDVIAYMADSYRTTAGNYNWIEIINLGKNYVDGMVDEITQDSVGINGVYYTNLSYGSIKLGDEGRFYLTQNGKIFFIEKKLNTNYAYILDAAFIQEGFEEYWQVKLLTKDNQIKIYNLADRYSYDNSSFRAYDSSSPLNYINLDYITNDVENRVITFNTNSNGYITEIFTSKVRLYDYAQYNESLPKLAKPLEDDTVIFNINPYDDNAPFAAGLDALIDENEYYTYLSANANGEYDCVVITEGECNHTAPDPVLPEPQYGYIAESYYNYNNFSFSPYWQVKILTSSDTVAVYDVAKKYTIDSVLYGTEEYSSPLSNFEGTSPTYNIQSRIVKFTLDADGKLKNVDTLPATQFSAQYTQSTQKLGTYTVSDAIVFDLSYNTYDDIYSSAADVLINANKYSGYLAQTTSGVAECVVLTDGITNYTEPLSDPMTGYITDAAFSTSGFTYSWMLKILDENGNTDIFELAEKFTLNGSRYRNDNESVFEAIANSSSDSNVDQRLITFVTNKYGLIVEINTLDTSASQWYNYTGETQSLGQTKVSDDVKIFVIDGKYSHVENLNFLVNTGEYQCLFTTDENDEINYIVMLKYSTLIDYSQSVAIVQSVSNILYDDGETEAKKVQYYSSADTHLKEIIITDDENISASIDGYQYNDIMPGAFIMFTDNGDGVACAYTVIGQAQTRNGYDIAPYTLNHQAAEQFCAGNYGCNGIIGGYIIDWENVSGKKLLYVNAIDNYKCNSAAGTLTNGSPVDEIVIDSSVNSYTFNTRNTYKLNVVSGDWQGTDTIDKMVSGSDDATYFLAFTIDGDVVDFITFSDRKDTTIVNYPSFSL